MRPLRPRSKATRFLAYDSQETVILVFFSTMETDVFFSRNFGRKKIARDANESIPTRVTNYIVRVMSNSWPILHFMLIVAEAYETKNISFC